MQLCRLNKLTQPFIPTKNDIRIEGYFIIDTILSLSHQRTLGGSYAPAFTVDEGLFIHGVLEIIQFYAHSYQVQSKNPVCEYHSTLELAA